jgi:uncharacterized protein (UPF0276 family)
LKRTACTGILYSPAFAAWLELAPASVGGLEVRASSFYHTGTRLVESIACGRPTIISGGWLSLGTPGPLDVNRASSFAALVKRTNPLWISEPLGFSNTEESTWSTYLPVSPGSRSLNTIVEHAIQVMEVCQKPLLLETTASSIQARGSIRETDFLNLVCQKANCGLLLDVTALLVNAVNHRFDPVEWLHQIDRRLILQLHVSGYTRRDHRCFDEHSNAVQEDVWHLLEEVLAYCSPRAIILEREGSYPPVFVIERELARLKELSRCASSEITG